MLGIQTAEINGHAVLSLALICGEKYSKWLIRTGKLTNIIDSDRENGECLNVQCLNANFSQGHS